MGGASLIMYYSGRSFTDNVITVGGASLIMYYSGRGFTDNVITVGGASLPVNMWEEELICQIQNTSLSLF